MKCTLLYCEWEYPVQYTANIEQSRKVHEIQTSSLYMVNYVRKNVGC